jgi:flagellar hook-length control protein FliK
MATTGSAGAGTPVAGSRAAARTAAAIAGPGAATAGGTADATLLDLLGTDADSFQAALAAMVAGGANPAGGTQAGLESQAAIGAEDRKRGKDAAAAAAAGQDAFAALAALLPWMNAAAPAPATGAAANASADGGGAAGIGATGAAGATGSDGADAALAQMLARHAQVDSAQDGDAADDGGAKQAASSATGAAAAAVAGSNVAVGGDRAMAAPLPVAPGGTSAPVTLAQLASAIAPVLAAGDAAAGGGFRDGDGRAAATAPPGGTPDAGLAAQVAGQGAQADAATPVVRSIAIPVHDRQWPQAMAAQVQLLSEQKVQAATIRLAPEHLGPVEVRIDLNQSRVDVTFTAAHAETRAALEQTVPELRAVLMGSGLTLGQATVQQQMRNGSQSAPDPARALPAVERDAQLEAAPVRLLGLVDEYV